MQRTKVVLDSRAFEIEIDGMDDEGRGVARRNGKVVFVTGALPGEHVRARLTRSRGKFDEAQTLAVLQPHPLRVEPHCEHFGECGGCSLQHWSAPAQVQHKQTRLLANLARIGKVQPEHVAAPITGPVWGYRSRARLGAQYLPKGGGVALGFREREGHRLAALKRCPVLPAALETRLFELRARLAALSVRARLPQIEVVVADFSGSSSTINCGTELDCVEPLAQTSSPRICADAHNTRGDQGSEAQVLLTLRHLQPLTDADRVLLADLAADTGFRLALQPGGPDTVHPLHPQHSLLFEYWLPEFDLQLQFEPMDFTQVNMTVNRALVSQAMQWLAPQELRSTLDLFCGIGNFTLPIACLGAKVTGVEGVPAAVRRATANAELNGLENVDFAVANLTDASACADWLKRDFDGLLLDPPRTGAQAVVSSIARKRAPRRIVYVSCSPASLARDVAELVHQYGYRLLKAGIVDMFPHTSHVESMVLLERD